MAMRRVALLHILRDTDAPPMLATGPFADMVAQSLDPSAAVERYGRHWRLSRPRTEANRFLLGKLGFERSRPSSRVFYDESLEDFVVEDAPTEAGTFSHYVLDLEDQYLVFDYRAPDIRLQSFIGAFQGILDASPVGRLLRAAPVADTAEFFQWLDEMDRIEVVRVTVRQPNPSFQGRPQRIRDLLQETRAQQVTVEAHASRNDDEGLQVQDTDLETLATYAADGNGEIRAQGFQASNTRRFSSKRSVKEDQIETTPDDTSESIFAKLRDTLARLTLR